MATVGFDARSVAAESGATVTLVKLVGSIDASTIVPFRDHMDGLLTKGVTNIVMDCSDVKYINSTGLGILLQYVDALNERGGNLIFCKVPSKVMLVMEMLGFNALFKIATTQEEALGWFGPVGEKPQIEEASTSGTDPMELMEAAPAPQPSAAGGASWPVVVESPRSMVKLEVPAPGKYLCPRSGAVFEVDSSGNAQFFAPSTPAPVELSLPCNEMLLDGIRDIVMLTAAAGKLKGSELEIVFLSIREACANVIKYSYGGDENGLLKLILIPNTEGGLEVRIVDYGRRFDFSGGSPASDERFSAVVTGMDSVSHKAIAGGGNLFILSKSA